MDFALSAAQDDARRRARALGQSLPGDADAGSVVSAAAGAGLLTASDDLLTVVLVVEAISESSAAAGITLALHACVLRSIGDHPALETLAGGQAVGAVALASDEYPVFDRNLSGRAAWVAPLTPEGLAVVGASSGGELTAYAVRLDSRSVTIDAIDTPALAGVRWGHLSFANVPAIPLGQTTPIMSRARVLLAAAALGMGRRALLEAMHVARAVNKLGAGGEQTVQGLLADAATDLDAAMLLTWKAASATVPSLADASLAKLSATEATQRAVARATQVVGSDSFTSGHIVERLARDVRALELFAGRTEALREAAAAAIL